ncbi:dihydroneopterin aldolase [Halobacillus seohaensis]|uniref:7,8-dihydroneopterin aldolase n=1 Tax=Halobacillus seohaensis TaxID=447421 RepID=A0ABW2ELE4_9BACI
MDQINVNGMEFWAYHGLFPEENKLGQRFYVDLELELNLKPAGTTDDMNESINYGDVYQVTKTIVEGEPKNLVETVSENLAGELLHQFSLLEGCRVKITKPDPPIPGHYKSVAIDIYRSRSDD